MKKFGLIGHPIDKSMSPALFRAGYSGKYAYDLIEGADFTASYDIFLKDYDGINVTAPFKEKACAEADILSPEVARTGAANLLVKTPEGVRAYNTDYYGVILSVADGILPEGGYGYYNRCGTDLSVLRHVLSVIFGRRPKALVAGCGGAGRAAAVAAASLGYRTVLLNRSVSKAEKIASDIPEYGFAVAGTERFRELFRESDLVIYTIPGNIPELASMDSSFYRGKNKIVLEANYKTPSFGPVQTGMLESEGGILVSGKRWLLYQAMTGFMIFTGERPDFQQMCKVI